MSLFSNATRVVNTATPDFPTEPNVTQYGWTKSDAGSYNQLIQYVDECRKIWLNLEEKILYVEGLLIAVGNIDAQVKYIEQMTSSVVQLHGETKTYRDQVSNLFNEVKPLYDDFLVKYPDIVDKWTDIIKMHEETLQAAIAAAQSEIGSKEWYDKSYELYLDLKEGQVYRGTWDPTTNAYPAVPTTNSVWDVTLPAGTGSHSFGGKTWRSGDRLLYVLSTAAWDQLATGGGVDSINGKSGAVTLGAADVGAAPAGFGLGGEGQSWADKNCDDINASGFYSIYSSTTGTPYSSGGPSGSQLIHTRWGGGAGGSQLFFSYTSDRVHYRRRYQSVWQPWFELYHTGKKPTPSDLGAVNKAGDTMTGDLGLGGTLTLNKFLVKGANDAVVLRDHGNGNVTLSASVGTTGTAGTLYLGYNAALTGTAGYNTNDIWINVPTKWQGKQTIIDGTGMVNSENFSGPIRTEKDSGGIMHTIIGGNDTTNRGRTIVVAGECGKHISENTTTGAETLHLAGDGSDGVYIHTGVQSGWGTNTHQRYQFKNGDIYAQQMDGTKINRFYHNGYKPTAADVGALGIAGTQTLTGNLLITSTVSSDPISLTQVFSPVGGNAQGISGYNSTDTSKRAWGVGAYTKDAVVEYAYVGVGESPWANGLRLYADRAMFNQKLDIGSQLTLTNSTAEAIVLNYTAGGDGSHIRGKEGGNNDWYVGRANPQGHVALYSNKLSNGLVIRDDYVESVKPLTVGSAGTVFFSQHASTVDLNTLSDYTKFGMYFQDANANATPARNYPVQEAGALIVMGGAYGGQQEYTTFSSGRKFTRGKNAAGSSSWRPWVEVGGIKDHCSGYRITAQTIAAGATGYLSPGVFPSALGITFTNGNFTIARSGTYKVEWGFSIEPTGANQQGVGSIYVNGVKKYDAMIYNYCPSTAGASPTTQMGTSSTSVIMPLNSGDKVSFGVTGVNNTSVRIYQAGYMTFTQL